MALALALAPMVPGEEGGDASPTEAAAEAGGDADPVVSASDPWHKVLLECGRYGEPDHVWMGRRVNGSRRHGTLPWP